jgi:hypothetical protein
LRDFAAATADVERKGDAGIAVAAPKETKMAKSQRRGNKEARKPKAAKPASAAPISPFAAKSASATTSPPKRKG